MRIDPLLAALVERIIERSGDVAARTRSGRFARPVDEWQNRDFIDFIDILRRETGDDYMGLAASRCAVGTADFMIELGTRCTTLREAIGICCRLMTVATDAFRFGLEEAGGQAIVSIRQEGDAATTTGALATWVMISWHKLLQWLINTEIPLDRTEFQHDLKGSYADHAAMFCADCLFNRDAGRLVFSARYLDHRVVRLPNEGDRLKATTPGYFSTPGLVARSWSQLVRDTLRTELAKGHSAPTIADLASEFGMSAETLRRRLKGEGIGYRELKAQTRLEIARHLVVDGNTTLGEASIGAGFAEANALGRSLKQSRGMTGKGLRETVLGRKQGDE